MHKKIIALLLALTFCLAAAGCSNDGAPDDMYSATIEGEPFYLYVPDAWTSNISSGISSAFRSGTDNVAVSARYYTHENGDMSLSDYITELTQTYSDTFEQFALSESNGSVLGGEDAYMLKYTASYKSEQFTFVQYITKHGGDFIFLTFRAPTELYDAYSEEFDTVREEFVLREREAVPEDAVTDKKTPEGMKIASSDIIEYRFYVPSTWICYSKSGVSEAYYPESGKPNVTVTSYSPDTNMTAEEYFTSVEGQYKESLSSYELISTEDRAVADREAKTYTYTVAYGEARVKIMQTVFVYNGIIYSITYTALDESFDAHMADVGKILDEFRFR